MKDREPADLTRRITAFFVDCTIVHVIRMFFLQISLFYFIKKDFVDFMQSFYENYGEYFTINKITPDNVGYLISSSFFIKIILIFLLSILISFFYNLFFLTRKKSATPGYRLVGLEVVSNDNDKLLWYQILARCFLIAVPWLTLLFLFIYQNIASLGLIKPIPNIIILIVFVFGFLGWYDTFFFTKNKTVMHDKLSRTRVVLYTTKEGILDSIFDSINDIFPSIKRNFCGLKDNIKTKINDIKQLKKDIKEKKKKK